MRAHDSATCVTLGGIAAHRGCDFLQRRPDGLGRTLMAETRRSIRQRRPKIIDDFNWLVEQEDEEGFRLWLKTYELVEGSEPYEQACEAWRESMLERQSPQRRPGAYVPARSRRIEPGGSR